MSQTVIGIFKNVNQAQNAADQLLDNGFDDSDVDVSSGDSYADESNDHESGIAKFFSNLFGDDDDERERYTTYAKNGTVVTVHAQSTEDAQRAAMLLDQYGASDMNADDRTKGYTGDKNYAADTKADYTADNDGDDKKISVIEEDLQVGKREVNTGGGVRLKSRIIEKPVEKSLRLRSERVTVNRNPVNRPATSADLDQFKEGTVEVTERAEVPVVSKEAKVVEEISIDKTVEHHDETVKDTVRKTQVDVENIEADNNYKKN